MGMEATTALGRIEEFVSTLSHLCSDASSFVSGQNGVLEAGRPRSTNIGRTTHAHDRETPCGPS
jgi:hypothetical protein